MELTRLSKESERHEFTCGDDDLDEFYHIDSIEGANQLTSVSYAIVQENRTIAYFSVSNDSIKKQDLPSKSALKRFLQSIPPGKRYASLPAVKIGRLGVCVAQAGNGVGTQILDFLKVWFTQGNKTGCRFLVVDAYNTEQGIKFYINNDFEFLTTEDKTDKTRIMYFDLIKFRE